MKKLTLFLVAIFAMVNVANAQRAWAYDLELTPSGDSYTFAFKAVTAGDATLVFYKEGAEAGTLNLGSISAGDNTVTKTSEELLEAIQQSGDFTWGVKMSAGAITAGATLTEIGSADFYNMMGVVVDNNPESSTFSQIYIQQAYEYTSGTTAERNKSQKAGIFIYDQQLNELNNPNNKGIVPNVPDAYKAYFGKNRDAMKRLAINPKTGQLAFCYNITLTGQAAAVWAMDLEELTPTAGSVTTVNLIDGITAFNKPNSLCFDEDGTLFVLADGGYSSTLGSLGTIYKIVDGTATAFSTFKYANGENAIASDGKGGLWVAQQRNNLDGFSAYTHHKADGEVDYTVTNKSSDEVKSLFQHTAEYMSKRGAIAYDVKRDILAVGGDKKVILFSVAYDATTGAPTLTKLFATPTIGGNIDGIAFDYAGDVYVVSSSSEKFQKFAVPTNNNTCTTPAKKSQVITLVSATPEHTVTINVNGNGTVTGANTGTYLEGTELSLTATPAEHHEFTGWTGDVTSTDNPLTIPVDGDKNITANFAKKQYTLTVFVNDENKGTIDVATGSHEYGTEVTLTATPKSGYKLLAWSNKATTPSITLTMDNNKAVSAYFVKEYATDPTFTIEKVWENTINIPGTGNGYQAVGWDGKIYMQDAGNKKIKVFSNGTDEAAEYASSGAGQQIAVDEAGNLIVFNAWFATGTPNAILIYPKGGTTGKEVTFTLPQPGRCDFFTASGDIYSAEGGYIYFYCNGTTVVNRLKITNGAATAADVTTDVICANLPSAGTQSNVVVDIFGNIHVESKQKSPGVYNITNLTTTTDTHLGGAGKNTLYSTIGGCTFELGGKEWWAYLAGTTDYSSEWQLYNETDGTCLSNELYLTATKTTAGTTANWLNAQVIDEKTVYIYQFCPKVGAALWEVSFTENYTVSATATNGTVTGTGTYQEGATATLTATPNTGYKFVNWTKGGVEVSTEATYSFPVTENVELVANFEALAQYNINAHADHTSKGYVTGGGDYYEGEEVTLKAVAKSAYYFTQWTDGNTDNPRTITVDGDKEYIAEFAEAHPRAWAYDMKLGEDGDNYTFTFKTTAAGQATITFKDKDGNALAQPASQTIAAVVGENKFTIAKNAFAAGVDAFWSITMDGEPIPAIAEVTDQTRGIYDFYNMMGVVVDNNTDSKDFGKIYIQQSYERSYASSSTSNNGLTTRSNDQKSGVFIYNQALEELNNPSNVGLKPTMPAGGYTEIGSSSSAFQRLNIDPKTGNLVFSHAVAGKPAVFAINRDDMTGAVTNLLTGVADMTRSVAHCFDAEGMLYVMNFAGSEGTVYKVENGEATPFSATSNKFINAYITMASDGRGGLWISQNRGQMDDAPYYYQLVHVTSTGEFDWWVNKQAPQGLEGSSSRGALAYDVERQILAQGRNGKVELYTVSYEPTITLTPLYTIASDHLGNNIDGLAFDYAGDLYVVNSSKEKFQKFTLPTDENNCTVAAPALEAIRFTPVYTISVESNNNEWGIANGGGTFEEGQNATITATAATNYKFVNWTKDGVVVSDENPYTFAVTESATYVANFVEKTQYTINVTIMDDAKMGTVDGAGTYYEGTEVTLTAKANAGYVFVDWSDGNTNETRTIEVTSDLNLTANFKVAVPRAWAYDLRLDADTDPANYIFTFTATSAGTATIFFTDEEGTSVAPTQEVVGTVAAGETKTVTIAKSAFTGDKDIYWSVKVDGAPIEKMAEITDPTRNIYDFYSTLGVVVDNNPESEYFGKIYVQATLTGASDGKTLRAQEQTAGLFIYDQKLEELNPTPNTGIQPSLPSGYSIGGTYQFNRLAIDPTTNNITYCYAVSGKPAVFSMDRANLTGTPANLLAEQTGITRSVAHCFDQEGNLYVMDLPGSGQIFKIEKNGTKSAFGESTTKYVQVNTSLASDGRGGLWVSQNRGQIDSYYQLVHYNASGTVDFAIYDDLGTYKVNPATLGTSSKGFTGSSLRGALAYDAERQILAQGRNSAVELFNVTYDAMTGVPTLTKFATTPTLSVANIDGLAFDYAGDLYVVNSGTERFYKYVIPTNNNTCTVPAPESQIIKKEARYTVTVVADPAEMGTVTEGGEYKAGEKVTLTATANTDYRFINWTIGSDVISTDASFEYTVPAENVTITAHFELKPLAMVGVVKRAVQIGESTVVLTHDNGTPHLYKVVDGELEAEISQVGVEAAAAGYLSISDIAATEDGKLVACNYIECTFEASNTSYFYIWNNLAGDPTIWFTSQKSTNYNNAYMGYTMAVKGTSTDAVVTISGFNKSNKKTRFSHLKVVGGSYDDATYEYSRDNAALHASVLGNAYELNASPLASANWIIDAELTSPIEFEGKNGVEIDTYTTMSETFFGKKFNGATYFSIAGAHFMVAPYADGENVAGVKIIDITNGLATAQELETRNITTPQAATAAATAVEVDGTNLLITLVADATIYTFDVALESSVTIDENADNTTALENYDGEVVTATVKRNFDANKYLTLTLPFDMNATQIRNVFGNATVYALYNVVEYNAEEVHLQFTPVSTITAGTPYILKTAASGYDAEDGFTIEGVAIDLSLKPVTSGTVTMVPVLDAGGTLNQSDEYFLSNNALYCAGTYPRDIMGLRAYFESTSPLPIRARVVFQDNAATSIPMVETQPANQVRKVLKDGQLIIIRGEEMYNMQGQRME